MKRVTTMLAGAVLLVSSPAFTAGEHGHGHGGHRPDAQMAKLHKMMPRYGAAQASINAALGAGDLKAVAKETAYLLSTAADLKKSRPHKNIKELAEFRAIAAGFERDIGKAAESAKRGDLAGAKAAFAGAEKGCAACHAKFRD